MQAGAAYSEALPNGYLQCNMPNNMQTMKA